MAFAKRIFLFIALNLLVVVTLSTLAAVLGIQPYLTAQGIDYQALMAFCLLWGMGGAFISLALSRVMAKWMMGVKVIDPRSVRDPELLALVETVHELSRAAGLGKMPEVGIYESPEVNAFATGPTKNRSLVAVSTGLLSRLRDHEVKGVLGHEVAHIANGDMVTMTLIQGVVNAFVMFLARIVAFAISQAMRGDREESSPVGGFAYHITVFALEIVFMLLGSMVVAWFSRYREYRADAGGARLAGSASMIDALQALRRTYDLNAQVEEHASGGQAVASLKISSRGSGLMRFFSTHPPLEERIARLRMRTG